VFFNKLLLADRGKLRRRAHRDKISSQQEVCYFCVHRRFGTPGVLRKLTMVAFFADGST
jgi:hypothetical protein